MNLFQHGAFTLASGKKSNFKIDCDALTDEDIETIAVMLVNRLPMYYAVVGIPTGGLRLAEAMKQYKVPFQPIRSDKLLIVDDVLTSGGSMERYRREKCLTPSDSLIIGAVIFDRSLDGTPDWITPLFRVTP